MARALTPDGLCRGRKTVAAKTEAGIYQALDLQYIEPELREGLDVRRTLPRPAHLVIEIQRVRDQTVAMGTDQHRPHAPEQHRARHCGHLRLHQAQAIITCQHEGDY